MSGRGLAVAVLVLAAGEVFADVDSNRLDGDDAPRGFRHDAWSPLDEVLRLWGECGGDGADVAGTCLKVRLVAALDRATRQLSGNVPLATGVTLVAEGGRDFVTPAVSERQLEAALPRGLVDREDALDTMILDKLGGFFGSHSLQFKMTALNDLQRSFSGEGEYQLLFHSYRDITACR
ncbi:hypothetical protein PR048_000107 [Dryococelus australis]|uniref:Uncharacterized protein n=1 Tax=Dryococelus australis TaxID=614101 RepID=A0ABQ9IDP5_9NEOP|nr:hypothetical protein PR048_000107 [Dryococelus australis]